MPFSPLNFVSGIVAAKLDASISYRRNTSEHAKNKRPKLIIGIPKAKAAGFKLDPKMWWTIQIGSDADAGKARIVPAATSATGVLCTELKGGFIFRFGYVPYLGDSAAERERVDVKVLPQNGGFELTLPAWFKPEEADEAPAGRTTGKRAA